MKLTELNDIELVRHYELARKKADKRINKLDYEDVFNLEVKPYLLEMERRGII